MRRPRAAAALMAGGAVAGYVEARRRFLQWGAEPGEVRGVLPRDELLAHPSMVTTRAITIDAPPEAVWPWLVQMGQDRGGFYSYDWLENLFGLQIHNATRVVPEWQALEVGDQLRAAPASAGAEAGFTVVAIDPGRSLVTAVGDPARVVPQATAGELPEGGTWVFVLRPEGPAHTRLVVRLRAAFELPGPARWLVERLLEPVHFAMERKQLLTLRARAGRGLAPADAPVAEDVSRASASTG